MEEKGYEVFVPEMPDTQHPKIAPWAGKLKEIIGEPKEDDILIGHSIGCLAVLRFLQTLENSKIEKVILIAPWHYLTLDENEDPDIVKAWTETPIDYKKIRSKADEFMAIFSDDDPWVPYKENVEFFKEKLNPELITKHKMGHFNVAEIPFLPDLL